MFKLADDRCSLQVCLVHHSHRSEPPSLWDTSLAVLCVQASPPSSRTCYRANAASCLCTDAAEGSDQTRLLLLLLLAASDSESFYSILRESMSEPVRVPVTYFLD